MTAIALMICRLELTDPSYHAGRPRRRPRVMQAMLGLTKFGIAALEKAYAGV
jgi:hypothetical protein